MKSNTHEDFNRREEVETATDRSFGLVFAAFFLLLGLWPLFKTGAIRWWAVAASAVFAGIALIYPTLLGPLNWLWARFGLLLARIVSPLALLVLYCLAVVPIGLLMRVFGKDPLRLKRKTTEKSYWIERETASLSDNLKEQF
jgi:hypothetical protein